MFGNMSDLPLSRILAVDDTPVNLTLLSRILTSHGYQVQAVASGQEAVEAAQTSHPDLILLDIAMPKMDGFEACSLLKDRESTRDIPIIFISALDAIEDKVQAFHAGGVDYIIKPFDYEEVIARVENHLSIRHLRLELQKTNRELASRVNELDASQQQLQERQNELQAFVNALPNLSFIIDDQGRYLEIHVNDNGLLSAPVEELKGRLVSEVNPPQVAEKIMTAIRRTAETGETVVIEYQAHVLAGDERWFEGRVARMGQPENGHARAILIATEISDRVRLYQEVQRLAVEDPLTGCYNRRHFFTLAEQELQRCVRYQHHLSLIMLDLDHFKIVNDRCGHPTGDKILCALVSLCQKQLRSMDVLGRYGGEEFVILMPETNTSGAVQAAERIRREVEHLTVNSTGGSSPVTVSIGVASLGTKFDGHPTVDLLLKRADTALYNAKAAGRNCVRSE